MDKLHSQQTQLPSKAQIRQEISLLEIKNRAERDRNLVEKLEKFSHRVILAFIPVKLEPNILLFLVSKYKSGVEVGIPSIIGDEMVFKVWNNRFKIGRFGLKESDTEKLVDLYQSEILCITPLVACTRDGKRLGRGGGYYDKFFAKNPHIFKVGVCYSEQILDEIPTESHDMRLDLVVSC